MAHSKKVDEKLYLIWVGNLQKIMAITGIRKEALAAEMNITPQYMSQVMRKGKECLSFRVFLAALFAIRKLVNESDAEDWKKEIAMASLKEIEEAYS